MADASFPPPFACDCHVHVIGPKTRFPLAPMRRYTPKDAPVSALAAMLRRLGLQRVVLVQPSFYASDNACMLDAMTRLPSARGVAVLAPQTSPAALDALHERGVRGLRVNIATSGAAPIETIKDEIATAAKLCARHGWHVQLFVAAAAIEPLVPVLTALPVDSVFDHFGLIAPDDTSSTLRTLQGLLASGKTWVKISGAYRINDDPNDERIGALARALCDANPERIVWGTDWPHTPRHHLHRGRRDEELPFRAIDTRGLLNLVPRWLQDDHLVQRVLVDNPAKLYGFS
jgi:predicted TIM-barrel fold metal-dependent hydrolase